MFVHTTSIKKILTIPSYILDDPNVSLGAKGLYVQLYYSNNSICSLNELTSTVNSTEEELKKYFQELADTGYIVIKDNKCDLLQKAVSSRSKNKTDVEEAAVYAETVQPKKLSAYEKMINLINSYSLTDNVKQLLITYFEKRMNKRGRFSEAEDLHGYVVRAMIGELVSFHLSEEDEIKCIQTSIDREWFKFVNPNNSSSNTGGSNSIFINENIESGTYTQEDIDEIKRKADELESLGEKGYY